MDFDPKDTTQYLEGVEYPASKEDLASAAEGNGAPEELVEATYLGPSHLLGSRGGCGRVGVFANLRMIL